MLWRLIVPCLSGLLLVGAANTFIWLERFSGETEATFVSRGTETTQIMAESVAKAVWTFDDRQAAEIMGGFAHVEGLVFSRIIIDEGVFAEFGEVAPDGTPSIAFADMETEPASLISSTERVVFSASIQYEDSGSIGSLTTAFTTQPAQALLADTRDATLVSQAVSFSILGLLLIFVLRSVTRPLRDITGVIEDVTAGDLKRDVPFLTRTDEVGLLAKAVSLFQENAQALVSVQAEAKANRLIAEKAVIDELTDLPNRRHLTELFERLDSEVVAGSGGGIALLHMDLDGFKQINDTLGHKAGDHVLKVVADKLRLHGKGCELVARIGGDEFVAVQRGSEDLQQRSRDLADALIRSIHEPSNFEGQTVRVGCSVGIAYHKAECRDLLETLVHADIALYKAKGNGKNQWVEFDEEQRRMLVRRKRLSDQIQLGLERREFVPFFQPIVDAETAEIRALEVLARWNHPELGLTGPDVFLELANELKLTRFIDRTILTQAISVMRTLGREVPDLPRLSVNVSVDRLMETDLLEVVKSLDSTPVRLDVELLESAYIDDASDRVIWHADALREHGVGIHIDDFGTGHSSLAGLLRVSPTCIKIDRRFAIAAPHSQRERALMESMIGIARSFEMDTICEGIETEEQARLLRELGCDMLQGHLFYRPMDADSLVSILLGATEARGSVGQSLN